MTRKDNKYRRIACLAAIILAACSGHLYAQTDVTGYETVTVTIPATAYDPTAGAPQMARVKYNKLFPLVITSDDMGKTELTNNWAAFNGYPVHTEKSSFPTGDDYLSTPYNTAYATNGSNVDNYTPMTYTDDVGKTHRFTATSAIWPQSADNNNYTLMNATDAKTMLRTGWSFAQHDVDEAADAATIASRFAALSSSWATRTGSAGLKVMVEPNGNHDYIAAGISSSEICWNIFQNASTEYPNLSLALDDWADTRSDWTTGGRQSDYTTFSSKPTGANERLFFQGHETEWQTKLNNALANNDNSNIILGGTHGIGTDIMSHLRSTVQPADKAWVASADEVWEYYHIYNNAYIDNVSFSDGNLTFQVHVPTYAKSMFRELTINIPGLTGGPASTDGTVTLSGATVVTGGYRQNASQFTINLGLESRYLNYIDELTALYREDPGNLFVKRDAQYLIDLLWPGSTKDAKQAALDKTFDYSYRAIANLKDGATTEGTKTLSSGYYDASTTVAYYFPRYILNGGSLYKSEGNGGYTQSNNILSRWWYRNSVTVNGADIEQTVDYDKQTGTFVFFSEMEDVPGFSSDRIATWPVNGSDVTNWNSYKGRASALGSSGAGVQLQNGDSYDNGTGVSPTITTLSAGKYKIALATLSSAASESGDNKYTILVGGTIVGTHQHTSSDTRLESITSEFEVATDGQAVTVSHNNDNRIYLDYIFIEKTGSLAPAVTITASPATAARTGDNITLTVNATLRGNSSLNSLELQKKVDGGEWTALATITSGLVSGDDVTHTFTPDAVGTCQFRARATDDGPLTSDWVETGTITVTAPANTVSLVSDIGTSPDVGSTATLTATATPATGQSVSRLVIEQETSTDVWEEVGDVYTAANPSRSDVVHRASSLDASTGEVTVTYDFTVSTVGTSYTFRSKAVFSDGSSTSTMLSSDAVASGGDGHTLSLTSTLPTPALAAYTLELIDHSGNSVFTESSVAAATITATTGDPLGGKYRSPFVSTYKYYKHTAEGKASAALGEDANLTNWSDENNDGAVYVGYEVDATKMAAAKEHIIYSGWTSSKVFMHPVYRGKQSNSNNFQNRYNMQHQKWDQENDGITPNEVNASNLPFVDQVYMWSLGTDPYHVMLTNNHIDSYKYVKTTYNSSSYSTTVSLQNSTSNGSVFSLLYWNGDTSSDYVSLRYLGDNTGDAAYMTDANAWYLCYDGGNQGCWRLYSNPTINDSYKFVIKTLPDLNVKVVNAVGAVEYTLKGHYVEGATVPSYTPFFLQRSYTSTHKYYYDSSCTQYATPNSAIDGTKFDGANIYVKYTLASEWDTESLFKVSDATNTYYYLLNYTANTSTPYLAVDGSKKVIGLATSATNEAHWALYGTPYTLRIENRANTGYYVGIPENAVWNTNPQVYNSFTNIISTWELAAYTNSNITPDYKPLPVIRPQGSISREAPLLHLRPDGTNAALFDHDDNKCRVTFEDATKVQLVLVDKSGRELFSEYVSMPVVTSTSGDPLSAGFRSPYAKNYRYYATKAEAQSNTGIALDEAAMLQKGQQTVYVGYDAVTADNVASGETILKMNGIAAYRIRRNASNQQGMHAVFAPSLTNSEGNNYGWRMFNQTKDYNDGSDNVVYNTLPFIDNAWAWEFVSSNNDPYNVKIRNRATGQYLRCENNSTRFYPAIFAATESEAAVYSLLRHGSGTQYLAIYVADGISSQTGYMYYNSGDGGKWSLRSDRNDATAYIRVEELTEPIDIHIVGPAGTAYEGEVEATIHGYRNSGVGANTVPAFVPYFLTRAYTSGQKFYYTKAAAAAATSGTEITTVADASITDSYGSDGVKDVFVSYILDNTNWRTGSATVDETAHTSAVKPSPSDGNLYWYAVRTNNDNNNYLKATATTLPTVITRSNSTYNAANKDTEQWKLAEWVLIGTPYNLKLAERSHGTSYCLGIADDAVSNASQAYLLGDNTTGYITNFEVVTGLASQTRLFIRPQSSLSGNAPLLYLGGSDNNMRLSRPAASPQALDFTYVTTTASVNVPTVTLTASTETPAKNEVVTITATASLNGGTAITSFVIQQKNSDGSYSDVETWTSGELTLTHTFTASEYGNYIFRAIAVTDNDAANLSTTTADLTVTLALTPGQTEYTLKLVDKSGNILHEENVTAATVSSTFGDPLSSDWRSPLVTEYYYYTTQTDAQANSGNNIFDWATETNTTVYAGYVVGNEIDLIEVDPTARQARSVSDATRVRNAASYTTMYLLKFNSGETFNQESGDDVGGQDQAVYPYTCGDGALYIYGENKRESDNRSASTTRERWPWYLVSQNNDPYHVVVTSWKETHSFSPTDDTYSASGFAQGSTTNCYNYLRTYYDGSRVVTNTITDDPRVTDSNVNGGSTDNIPTEYMILGKAHNYKLTTTNLVNGSHQTVNTMEQYWKTWETVRQGAVGNKTYTSGVYSKLDGNVHTIDAWAYARPDEAERQNKRYVYETHYYQTIAMGETFDLEPVNLNGVIVLLDKHGWEIMRKPLAAPGAGDEAKVKSSLAAYDSPMVEAYHFYTTGSKATGYHIYTVSNPATDGSDEEVTATSLADYPIVTNKYGNISDLYVTYDVKAEYADTYAASATAEGSPSKFLIRQGTSYAKADGSAITATTSADATDNAMLWYVKPNYNIDSEMGYTGEAKEYTAEDNGFDPYNLRMQNVSTATYFTTNANAAEFDGTGSFESSYPNGSMTVSLTDATATMNATGHDDTALAISNATFMAVQDQNGNMRLMPRFDHGHVIEGFTVLNTQAPAQAADDKSHAQTTLFGVPITYHVVDLSGDVAFSTTVTDALTLSLPKACRSPFAEDYTYHTTLAHAAASETRATSDVTTSPAPAEVWVGYAATSDFTDDKAYAIWADNGMYMHAVFQNAGNSDNIFVMSSQNYDAYNDATYSPNAISTSTLPFIDNNFMWQLGADPYKVKLKNKASGWYHTPTGNSTSTISKTDNGAAYCILYWQGDDTTPYYNLRYRDAAEKYVLTSDYHDWRAWASSEINNDARRNQTKLYIQELPEISINILNAGNTVECTLQGYYMSGATMPGFTPWYLRRMYTSGHTFYYSYTDATTNDPVTVGSAVDDDKIADNWSIYVKYTLDAEWHSVDETNKANTATAGENTLQFKSLLTGDSEINWYGIRARAEDNKFLKAGSTGTPAVVAHTTRTVMLSSDTDDGKLAQWAIVGTPYSFRIVERYHGIGYSLGFAEDAAEDADFSVYAASTPNVVTRWEAHPLLTNSDRFFIRPQGSLNGEAPLFFPGWAGGKNVSGAMGVGANTNSNFGLQMTWAAVTPATSVTFMLRDKTGDTVDGIVDVTVVGVSEGTNLKSIFLTTNLPRRFCDYTFYSDASLSTEIESATSTIIQNVYAAWDYSDDAPVFNNGITNPRDYQYYMMSQSNGSYSYNLDVEGNATDGYVLTPRNGVISIKAYNQQFALVGTPYSFRIYNRLMNEFIRRKADLTITFDDKEEDGTTDTEEITFDSPLPSASHSNTQFYIRSKRTGRYLTSLASSFYMNSNHTGFARLENIIIPVRIYKKGETLETQQKDYRQYAMPLNTGGTALETTARVTDQDLRTSASAVGNAHDFYHAFCNYTFYYGYDWTTGELSHPIPSAGANAGLPYYGGREQYKRQFFGTYTVDEDAFGQVYLINSKSGTYDIYIGKDALGTNGYTFKGTDSRETAKTDPSLAYRWVFSGDPYDLQIFNLGLEDAAKDFPLGVQTVSTAGDNVTEENGKKMLLTSDPAYGVYSHWEIIQKTDGSYVFWNIDEGEAMRYTKSFTRVYDGHVNTAVLRMEEDEATLYLTLPVDQYAVHWRVIEGSAVVDQSDIARVAEGTVFTLDDLPEALQRRFCVYSQMYSDLACTTAYTGNTVTVDGEKYIYVPYTLRNGAPTFYASVSDYQNIYDAYASDNTQEEPDPNLIRFYQNKYVNESSSGSTEIVPTKDAANAKGKWVLIGSPYGVQFYNAATHDYLYVDMDNISPGNAILTGAATGTSDNRTWELFDDASGERAAICLHEDDGQHLIYMGWNGTDVVMQILTEAYLAQGAEFIGNHGVDGLILALTYSNATLRRENGISGNSMAGQTETFTLDTYQAEGTALTDVMPEWLKRSFCTYSFTYQGSTATEITRQMCTDATTAASSGNLITINITYDYTAKAPFKWSTQSAAGDGSDLHWYYMVNHHRQGINDGYMFFKTNEHYLRTSEDYLPTWFYTTNYEWCAIGDPYGFRMLGHYDPDQRWCQYVSLNTDSSSPEYNNFETVAENDNNIFEMRISYWDAGNYFWMHPIFDNTYMNEGVTSIRSFGSAINHPVLTPNDYAKRLRGSTTHNYRLTELNPNVMAEYVKYHGFVGGLSNEMINSLTEDELTTYEAIKAKVDAGTDLTAEDARFIHELLESPGGTVTMKQGYYRIVPYVIEKGEHNETAARGYLRGYLYGHGTSGTDYKEKKEYEYADNTKTSSHSLMSKPLMLNETPEDAEYDPSSIFYFKATNSTEGYPRFHVSTQGLNLKTTGHLEDEAPDDCRYENIGGMFAQVRVGDAVDVFNYLSWVQNFSGNYPVNARRIAMRNSFELYHGTRMYIQPIGDEDYEDNNLLPLRLKMDEGVYEGNDYYFASMYVPYDLLIEGDATAYYGARTRHLDRTTLYNRSEWTPGWSYSANGGIDTEFRDDWRLQCEPLPAVLDTDGQTVLYEEGKFIPAGTPVLLRIPTADMTTDPQGNHSIRLTLPNDSPLSGVSISGNLFKGTYLEKVLDSTLEPELATTGNIVYVFGQATDTDYTRKTSDEVGFFLNKNSDSYGETQDYDKATGTASGQYNHRYVRHNKLYYVDQDTKSALVQSGARRMGVQFDADGITEYDTNGGQNVRTNGTYDLQGRRRSDDADGRLRPGLYIRDGKKTVIRKH